ncbi:hypothetical protein [Saccharothrix longispora]|uniref:hypothetical protein n=1 Tax=Saccharothrix longispora TaxID=33920 RepID=UPI0028FDA6FC|nr:hypothetical protein [Saccharothrix longispora]MDU0294496.1 hypothetical protein [Saccharothrix longispora]
MMFYLNISKHSPSERARARFEGEWGWTSFDEIGQVFDGRELTLRDYVEVEDRYVCAVRAVMDLLGVQEAVLRHVFVEELPEDLGELYNGRVVGQQEVEVLIRTMLRGADYHAHLDLGGGVGVQVGFDFYLHVYAPSDLSAFAEAAGECGLYVDHFEVEDDPDDHDVPPPPAGHDFWASVRAAVEASAEPVLLMERRARGRYGEEWYLVGTEDLDDVVSGLRAGAEVLVYPDLEVTTTTPGDLVESVAWSVGSLSSIVLFRWPRPLPRLDYLRLSAGLGPTVPEAFVEAEGVGYFLDPDLEATDIRCLRATV